MTRGSPPAWVHEESRVVVLELALAGGGAFTCQKCGRLVNQGSKYLRLVPPPAASSTARGIGFTFGHGCFCSLRDATDFVTTAPGGTYPGLNRWLRSLPASI